MIASWRSMFVTLLALILLACLIALGLFLLALSPFFVLAMFIVALTPRELPWLNTR